MVLGEITASSASVRPSPRLPHPNSCHPWYHNPHSPQQNQSNFYAYDRAAPEQHLNAVPTVPVLVCVLVQVLVVVLGGGVHTRSGRWEIRRGGIVVVAGRSAGTVESALEEV
jgi:hypothetical protein